MGLFDGYFDPQQFEASGGLLGRLLSLQRQQGGYDPDAGLGPPSPAPTPIPGFSGLGLSPSYMPTAMHNIQPQTAATNPVPFNGGWSEVPPVARTASWQPGGNPATGLTTTDRSVLSDASPDPIRPGSQYAQAPLGLCAVGPAGCAAGVGLTAGQMLLGGAALGGLGAIILNSRGYRPPAGSRPINQTPWSGDHGQSKRPWAPRALIMS